MHTKVYSNINEIIGNTPIIKLSKIKGNNIADIYAKIESYNPGGSIKDRIALGMIEDAEKKGIINKDTTIIEPSSGNTGISIAMICAVKGYKCLIVMPDSMTLEKVYIIKSYGAEVILTKSSEGLDGTVKKAKELSEKIKNSVVLNQFENQVNCDIHKNITANEIIDAFDNKIDAFVAGIGTGGTITGIGEKLKQKIPDIKIIGVEPSVSNTLSGNGMKNHKIPGLGPGFLPPIINKDIIDEIIKVNENEAYNMAKLLARKEGLLVGISSGANVVASIKVAENIGKGKTVVTILPDTGERYFSIDQYYKL
jgi:cysteine synthase A